MRYVVKNSQVPHLWANQLQSRASGGGSISFEEAALFSYNEMIGHLVNAPDGTKVALLTSRKWSQTTSTHQRAAREAVSHMPHFTVAALVKETDHTRNLASLVEDYTEMVDASFHRRNWREFDADSVKAKAKAVRDYAELFGLTAPHIDSDKDCAAICASHNDPEKLAARKDRAETVASDWRQGARRTLPYNAKHDAHGGALLRIVGMRVETSFGASVPLADAIKVFNRAAACRANGATWRRNGDRLPVGSFSVYEISADGSFKAGCHKFNWPEVERAARSAGIIQ